MQPQQTEEERREATRLARAKDQSRQYRPPEKQYEYDDRSDWDIADWEFEQDDGPIDDYDDFHDDYETARNRKFRLKQIAIWRKEDAEKKKVQESAARARRIREGTYVRTGYLRGNFLPIGSKASEERYKAAVLKNIERREAIKKSKQDAKNEKATQFARMKDAMREEMPESDTTQLRAAERKYIEPYSDYTRSKAYKKARAQEMKTLEKDWKYWETFDPVRRSFSRKNIEQERYYELQLEIDAEFEAERQREAQERAKLEQAGRYIQNDKKPSYWERLKKAPALMLKNLFGK